MITISMSTGIICCIATFTFILVAIWWIYKNRSKSINHPIVIGMSAISLIIAVTTAIYLCCQGGCYGISNINFGDASVSVLGTIVGLLVGWNIYNVIDVKGIRDDYEGLKAELNASIEEQNTERTRLREYVDILQNFTMANVRMTENKYGDALALYCDSAIGLNRMRVEFGLGRHSEESELMIKSLNMANSIVKDDKDIKNSEILDDRHQEIIDGLRGITSRNPRPIMDAIASVYTKR